MLSRVLPLSLSLSRYVSLVAYRNFSNDRRISRSSLLVFFFLNLTNIITDETCSLSMAHFRILLRSLPEPVP